ncbi:hypothetical protein PGTUg99_032572 [Puccinia graminis f. sp. tritici]|uniref:Uncharacterized protein n=1 Tax=Puccinia graminis f. sp. tritici TaxID=56615 RepID=A0A5B0SEM2_PUCGR|nr:hypothetical protein PGTUg99_032572 [Puccinia graminis f. sp. tritici]
MDAGRRPAGEVAWKKSPARAAQGSGPPQCTKEACKLGVHLPLDRGSSCGSFQIGRKARLNTQTSVSKTPQVLCASHASHLCPSLARSPSFRKLVSRPPDYTRREGRVKLDPSPIAVRDDRSRLMNETTSDTIRRNLLRDEASSKFVKVHTGDVFRV